MPISQLLFSFEGRIPRSTYWIASLTLGVLHYLMTFGLLTLAEEDVFGSIMVIPLLAWCLFVIVAGIAIQVKRWHDRDKSGAWVLIGFVPIIGAFWVFIECGFLRGTEGPNVYGPDPLS